ncbi:MAG: hypothetical protein HFH38_03435 [Lachnospiraceae bacterium]|jgi:hypothetical protein|nr:hypothetical protein [Lachnospiraceae bacterium]
MRGRKKDRRAIALKACVLFFMIAAAWHFLLEGGGFHAAFSFFQDVEGEGEVLPITSTDYRYDKKFKNTLNQYRFFGSLYKEEYSTAIPGLESTDILGRGCNRMVPQGICIARDYMLVTAYDNVKHMAGKKGAGGAAANRSVLYVLSNEDPTARKLLSTIVLPDVNHVGGIAFDGENIWIAKSTDRECSVISYGVIEQAVREGAGSYALEAYGQNVPCGAVASFLAWHEGKLWVGTYINRKNGEGKLRSYQVVKEEAEGGQAYRLELQDEMGIPGYANGVAFTEIGRESYMAVTTSKGRYFHSWIYLYQLGEDEKTGEKRYECYDSRKFPPMAEELVCDGRTVYVLFESSATCYSTLAYRKCSYPVDRICALSTLGLFWQQEAYGNGFGAGSGHIRITQEEKYQEKRYWWEYWCGTDC